MTGLLVDASSLLLVLLEIPRGRKIWERLCWYIFDSKERT